MPTASHARRASRWNRSTCNRSGSSGLAQKVPRSQGRRSVMPSLEGAAERRPLNAVLRAFALLPILLDRLHHALHAGAEERRAVLLHPFHAAPRVGVGVLEVRHDVARDELVAASRRGAIGPFVRGDEEGAEAAGLILQPLDLPDQIVRGADDDEAGLDHRVQALLRLALFGYTRQGDDALEVV